MENNNNMDSINNFMEHYEGYNPYGYPQPTPIFNSPFNSPFNNPDPTIARPPIGKKLQKNFLSDEEYNTLINSRKQQFTLAITKKEHLIAKCNHRSNDGTRDMLIEDPEDPAYCICEVCGAKFKVVDYQREEIKSRVNEVIDIIQTIKLLFVDFPADAAEVYFDIIPMLEKLPELFDLAIKSFNRYSNIPGFTTPLMDYMNRFENDIDEIHSYEEDITPKRRGRKKKTEEE